MPVDENSFLIVPVYVCVHVHTCVCTCTCVCIRPSACVYERACVCTCPGTSVRTCACVCACMGVHGCGCAWVHVFAPVPVCVHTHVPPVREREGLAELPGGMEVVPAVSAAVGSYHSIRLLAVGSTFHTVL